MVQEAGDSDYNVLSQAKAGVGTGKSGTPGEGERCAEHAASGQHALGVSFEAVPCQYVSRLEEAEIKGHIILRKGEWTVEIRNGTEEELLSRILEVLQ